MVMLREWKPRQPILASRLNEIQQAIMQILRGGRGINVQAHGGEVILEASLPNSVPQTNAPTVKVTAIEDDYLECTLYDPVNDVDGAAINVAKPYLLRKTPFDGETIAFPNGQNVTYTYDAVNPERKREADDGVTTFDQEMNPMYFVGDQLRIERGNTGVQAAGVNLGWTDKNNGGRQWAKVA